VTVTGLPYLRPPELVRRSPWQDAHETRVANWIQPWDGQEPFDVGLLMVPIARGAIKHVAAHLGPNALRMVWPFFTTYSIDYDVDLVDLRVRDLGDVEISLLDVSEAHHAIEAAATALLTRNRDFFPITIGGEHSLAHPLLRAFKASRGYERLGLIQFDAHMDFQTGEHGPHNGTPIRTILEEGIVDARSLVQIGIAGFVQAEWHVRWGRDLGATIFTSRDVAT
jgi:formiminoglutamase